ncbi:ATP-grasp domain-containing protein [Methanocaldococcus bathoardescens]|uniref:ATP-grasp domain-containing protein n=1 Tax=Methanocaldococcus bathoardescens TaxID=1301915 RepID=UPI00156654FE|nr:ATP-grasp domain-containing protein [Methanocaldococcus bathoardescens]
MKALVLGVNTRPIVNSLKKLGFYVYSVSYYAPEDLNADKKYYLINPLAHGRLKENYNENRLIEIANELVDEVDYVFITSGVFEFENSKIPKWDNVVGNEPKKINEISNKHKTYKKLKNLGFNIPETKKINNKTQLYKFLEEFKFCILKPIYGSGGGILKINLNNLNDGLIYGIKFPIIAQEYVRGKSFSANFIGNTFITFNKQIIIKGMYAGNLTPYLNLPNKFVKIFGEVIETFELKGMNGIDFLIKDSEPYIVDINPRILGTFETIEMSASQNLAKALLNNNYAKEIKPKESYIKRILFAKEKIIVNISKRDFIYDIPKKNAVIEKGEPIATVIAKENIKSIINSIYGECAEYEKRKEDREDI